MIYTTIDTNWLDAIDGLAVSGAIAYLQTLDPDHRLQYVLDGDTHGVEIVASLQAVREETPEELEQIRVQRLQRAIKRLEDSIVYYTKQNKRAKVETCERQLTKLKEKLK